MCSGVLGCNIRYVRMYCNIVNMKSYKLASECEIIHTHILYVSSPYAVFSLFDTQSIAYYCYPGMLIKFYIQCHIINISRTLVHWRWWMKCLH